MKKTYQRPTITEIEVELNQIVCLSNLGDTEDTSGNLSRQSSGFDDDPWDE